MKEKPIEESMAELMTACGFGTVVLPVSPVSGGLMHRMYKVTTDCGVYAVKHLNPEIMRRPNARDNYDRAEKIESLLEKKGIPIVPTLSVDGRKMQNVEGNRFYIFNWQEGRITDWNHISNDQCKAAGSILGRIHAIQPENVPNREPALCEINWNGYVRRAKEQKSEIALLLTDNVRLLTYAVKELNRARASLPAISCVSNEDMDPKNVMWDNGRPWVIDLECLDYGNPVSHALQLALQWSGIVTCHMDPEKMLAFFHGYLDAYDNGFRSYSGVFGLAYTWVEWLEYNIQRALGACGDQTEQALGISEVRNTIERIRYIRSMEEEIRDVLDSRLP